MTQKQAEDKGYVPTTIRSKDAEIAKAKAEKYRARSGRPACVVTEKNNKGEKVYVVYHLKDNKAPKKRGPAPMQTPVERRCRYCKDIFPIQDFYPSKTSSGGHSYICKKCNTVVVRESSLRRRLRKLGREGFTAEIERLKHEISVRRRILKHTEE